MHNLVPFFFLRKRGAFWINKKVGHFVGSFVVVHFFFWEGRSVLNKYKFGNALFEVIGGVLSLFITDLCVQCFIYKALRQTVTQTWVTHKLRYRFFWSSRRGAFCHNSLVCICVMFRQSLRRNWFLITLGYRCIYSYSIVLLLPMFFDQFDHVTIWFWGKL